MRPIVDGLREEYEADAGFVYLNARDGADGERAFETLALPGHPAFLIFDSAGTERFRTYGVVEEESLRQALEQVLESEPGTS